MRPGQKLLVNGTAVEIVGTMQRTGNPGFDNAIFMNERPMREILDVAEDYSVITAKTEGEAVVSLAITAVTRDLRRHRDVKEREEDFTVQSSAQLLESINTILDVIQAVLVGIAAISLIVGGIGIMNTMYTSVLERTREIGIMKAIGATNAHILTIFLSEAAILGVIGGGIGIALGIGLAKAVEAVGTLALGPGLLQADISLVVVAGALAFSMGVGAVSGAMPAMQASRMEPVEALNA
jgi:putative ABC transport system permease protein